MVFKRLKSPIIREFISNGWLLVSVIVSLLVISLLVWTVSHSYVTIMNFNNRKLPLERASGELLLYTKNMEMSVHMAAATGDLRWKENYDEYHYKLHEILETIPILLDSEEVTQGTKNIKHNLDNLHAIENQAFNLISRGERSEASDLLSGWSYTKQHLNFNDSTENLANILDEHVSNRIALIERISRALTAIVALSLIVLFLSWFYSIKAWRMNYQKRKDKEEEITYMSYHDSLTDLYNRRYFEEEFNRLNVARQLPITIILGDVDNLKLINDNFGHKKGDELLIELSRILKASVREEDLVSRWGGDEFGIILPNTDHQTAEQVIKRIEKGCQASDLKPFPPSISIGFAVKTEVEQSLDEIFAAAENKMYQNKECKTRTG